MPTLEPSSNEHEILEPLQREIQNATDDVVSRKKIAIPQRMSVWDLRGRCNNSVASNMLVYRSIGMFTDPEVTFTEAWESTCRSGPLTLRLSVNFALITILVACKAKSPGAVWAEAGSSHDIAAMQPAARIAQRRKLQIIDRTPQQQGFNGKSVYTEPTILFCRYRS